VGYSVCGRSEVLCLPGTEYLYSDLLFIFLGQTNATMTWTSSIQDSKFEHFVPCFTVITNWRGKSVTFRYLYQLQRFSHYLGRQTAEENSIISAFTTCTTHSSRNNVRTLEKMRTMLCGEIVWESKNLQNLKEWEYRIPKRKWDDTIEIGLKERYCLDEIREILHIRTTLKLISKKQGVGRIDLPRHTNQW
jgi:hypothetical protein